MRARVTPLLAEPSVVCVVHCVHNTCRLRQYLRDQSTDALRRGARVCRLARVFVWRGRRLLVSARAETRGRPAGRPFASERELSLKQRRAHNLEAREHSEAANPMTR